MASHRTFVFVVAVSTVIINVIISETRSFLTVAVLRRYFTSVAFVVSISFSFTFPNILSNISLVVSLFGINNAVTRPYVDIEKWKEDPEFISKDSIRIYGSKELLNTLVAKDGTSLCIFVKHQDGLSVKKSDTLVKALKSILQEYKVDGIHLAGTTVGQRYYIEKMNSELLFFMALSAILVILFLFIAFRSGWGILVPQVVICQL